MRNYKQINDIKQKKDRLLNKILLKLQSLGLTSNLLTLFSFLFGILAFVSFLNSNILYGVFLSISILFDVFDGGLARLEKKKGKEKFKGILYDDLSDRIITFLILAKACLFLNFCQIPWILFLYPIIKGAHIFQKQLYKENFTILYFDRIPLILFIFGIYRLALLALLLSLLFNIFELIIAVKKRS